MLKREVLSPRRPRLLLLLVVGLLVGGVIAWGFGSSPKEPGVVLTALPTPGVPRTIPVCGLTTPGSAWTRHTIYDDIRGSDGVKLADFDGDGDMDVVSPFEQSGFTTLSLHPGASAVRGSGEWTTGQIVTIPSNEGACIGDIDLDGRLDIVGMAQGGSSPIVRFGPALNSDLTDPADWVTMTLTNYNAIGINYMTCAIADLTGDSRPEIIIGGDGAAGELFYIVAPAATPRTAAAWGLASARVTVETSGRIMTLVAMDLDGGTGIDLLYSTRNAPNIGVRKALNNGTGTLTPSVVSGVSVFMQFRIGDIDDDGDMDICSTSDALLIRCMNNIAGTFGRMVHTTLPYPATFGSGQGAAIGDLDLDGYPDVVVASYNATAGSQSGLVWLRAPYWARGEIEGTAHTVVSKWDELELVDLDADGDLDLVAGNSGNEDGVLDAGEGLYWYENPCLN